MQQLLVFYEAAFEDKSLLKKKSLGTYLRKTEIYATIISVLWGSIRGQTFFEKEVTRDILEEDWNKMHVTNIIIEL